MAVSRFNPDYPDAGLVQVVPTSVAVGSGSGSVDGNGTVTFSGASSISLNNCFSSIFNNYVLIVSSSLSASAETRMRLRTSGTDATGTNYDFYSNAFTTTFNNQSSGSGQTSAYINGSSSKMIFQFHIYDPFNATDTVFNAYGNVSTTNTIASSGYHGLSTSYDGITIYRSSGTMTGSIQVYGYRK